METPSTDERQREIHAIVKGRVQGVGFRATVSHLAKRLTLSGTVRNLSDGTVEIRAQGSLRSINALFEALNQEFGSAGISGIQQEESPFHSSFDGFSIIR